MRFIVKAFMLCIILVVFSQRMAVSGTVDNATLSPSGSTILNGKAQEITFSAMNDKPFALKDYYVKIKYDEGLSVTNLSVSPPVVKAEVSTKRNLIEIKWENIQPDTELKAVFNVSNSVDVYSATYNITPQGILFHDYNRNRYAGTCNVATIIVRAELIPPASPKNVNCIPGDGYIKILWDPNTETDIAGYDVYRSSDSMSYVKIGTTSETYYSDSGVNDASTYYYKVRAVDKFGNESEFSTATAETYRDIIVRTYNSPGAAAAATGDINGDGKPDLALGYPSYCSGKGRTRVCSGKVDIYYGGNTSIIPDVTIYGENSDDNFGYSLAVVDLNDDGYNDLVVGAPFHDPYLTWPESGTALEAGKVYVYAGAPHLSPTATLTIDGRWSIGCDGTCYYLLVSEKFGFSIAPAGDIDGDGYKDVAIGAPYGGMSRSGSVIVLLGGPSITDRTLEAIGPNPWDLMGYSVAAAGDMNRDGFSDLIVGATTNDTYPVDGKAHILHGGTGIEVSDIVFQGGQGDYGQAVAGLDMNGDGHSDIAVYSSWGVNLYYGGPNVINNPDVVFSNPGNFIASLGDMNRDGYEDLLSGGPVVYFGGNTGENIPDISRTGVNIEIIGVGDIDNDGVKDVIAADPDKVYIYSLVPYLGLPEITVFTPKAKSATGIRDISINGAIKGNVVKLLVGGQQVPISPDGSFSTLVSLFEGINIIEATAETPDGKISKRTLSIRYSSQITPITVSIASPADGSNLSSTPVTVTGTVSGASATVKINGVRATVSGSTFTVNINLKEGPNTITAAATDVYGQTASHSITVTLLARGSVTGTVTDSSTGMPVSNVSATLTDLSETHTAATDSGGAYTVSGVIQGSFTATFEKAGYVKQTINGTLSAGQTLTLNVQMTPVPPLTITITSPQDGAVVNSSPITVAGDVGNNASVTVNGIQASLSGSTFSASLPLTEGQNTIMAVAADQYGQSVSKSIRVTLSTKGILTGTVADSQTGLPLSQARVTVTDSLNVTQTALTDNNGIYTIAGIADGTFTGNITKEGYAAYAFTGAMSAGQTITTNAALTPIPLIISSIAVSSITFDSARVTWQTDQPSDSLVEYGTTAAYGTSVSSPTLTTTHSITLTGLAPSTAYHFRVISKNSFGGISSSNDNTFTTPGPVTLAVASPSEGSVIPRPDVTVTGTITNAAGNETGVTVNGKVAYVYGEQFTANHIPLLDGSNAITVTATDTAGNTATASIMVNAVTTGNYVRLTSNIESGIAALEATLTIDSTTPIAGSFITYQGPGPVEFISMTQTEYRVRMTAEGTYYFTADVTGTDGNVYQDTVAVTVTDKARIDALLKGKWEGMKRSLVNGNIEEAVRNVNETTKQHYRDLFTALQSNMPDVVQELQEIQLLYIRNNSARYLMSRNESYGGQMVTVDYAVYFIVDSIGIWKIDWY